MLKMVLSININHGFYSLKEYATFKTIFFIFFLFFVDNAQLIVLDDQIFHLRESSLQLKDFVKYKNVHR